MIVDAHAAVADPVLGTRVDAGSGVVPGLPAASTPVRLVFIDVEASIENGRDGNRIRLATADRDQCSARQLIWLV